MCAFLATPSMVLVPAGLASLGGLFGLKMESRPRALYRMGKRSVAELHPAPDSAFLTKPRGFVCMLKSSKHQAQFQNTQSQLMLWPVMSRAHTAGSKVPILTRLEKNREKKNIGISSGQCSH